jgi:hypothetical protein
VSELAVEFKGIASDFHITTEAGVGPGSGMKDSCWQRLREASRLGISIQAYAPMAGGLLAKPWTKWRIAREGGIQPHLRGVLLRVLYYFPSIPQVSGRI